MTLVVVLPLPPFWFAMANVLIAFLSPSVLSARRPSPGPRLLRAPHLGATVRHACLPHPTGKTAPKYHSPSAVNPLWGSPVPQTPGRSGCQSYQGTASYGGLPVYEFSGLPCHNQTRLSTWGCGCRRNQGYFHRTPGPPERKPAGLAVIFMAGDFSWQKKCADLILMVQNSG